jgi:outer membrane biosynthesis protein TonB
MRRAAGVGILVLVGAFLVPIAGARQVEAASPTLTLTSSPSSGLPGTAITYAYFWDAADCPSSVVAAGGITIDLQWDSPFTDGIGTGTASVDGSGNCVGSVSAQVPADSTTGAHSPTAVLSGAANNGSEATASDSFTVTSPTPPPTPTPKPTPKPTPRPTPTQGPTPTPVPTPKPTPTPTPLPTPPAFIGGGGGGGSGGGAAEGGAACSGGIGRTPTSDELTTDVAHLAAGADPSTVQIEILASAEYYQDTGGTPLDFVNRLYDDVLRHDPTPVEVAQALEIIGSGGGTERMQLVQDVVLSPEARAIRVDQAFHTLLDTYPSSAELALWVNRLTSATAPGLSGNALVAEVAASAAYYTRVGSKGSEFVSTLYEELLSRSPTATELKDDATLIAEINAGDAVPRLTVADRVVTSSEYLTDQVTSFFANYLHPTCAALRSQECGSILGSPSDAELSAALTALAGSSTEENVIAGVLGSDQYYQNQGSSQSGLIDGVYWDLLGRAPTSAEMSAALNDYPNDPLGHAAFAQAMTSSPAYQDLIVSLVYQQLLLRAPLASETTTAVGVLGGDTPSLQTPDQTLQEELLATPEYLSDAGGTPSRFVVRTLETLLMAVPSESTQLQYLAEPLPHDARWQTGVAEAILDGSQYETDFVRGVYERFLTYTLCTTVSSVGGGGTKDPGFLKQVPGGWVGVGLIAVVVLLGAAAAVFFTIERRRFARTYPDEIPRHGA